MKPLHPERNTSKPAEAQGLFHKFNVTRTDGSDKPGGEHNGCEYFVLDVDHDQHAKSALQAYAASCAQSHPQLSVDLIARHGAQSAQVWHEGEPPFPQNQEWFIAKTIYGDKVVLTALPKEYAYDYKTADNTFMSAKNIAKWMQFPDCKYLPPAAPQGEQQ